MPLSSESFNSKLKQWTRFSCNAASSYYLLNVIVCIFPPLPSACLLCPLTLKLPLPYAVRKKTAAEHHHITYYIYCFLCVILQEWNGWVRSPKVSFPFRLETEHWNLQSSYSRLNKGPKIKINRYVIITVTM